MDDIDIVNSDSEETGNLSGVRGIVILFAEPRVGAYDPEGRTPRKRT